MRPTHPPTKGAPGHHQGSSHGEAAQQHADEGPCLCGGAHPSAPRNQSFLTQTTSHARIPQRLTHLVSTTYAYVRPAAYYGFIPFVLYVGMLGDAAPT